MLLTTRDLTPLNRKDIERQFGRLIGISEVVNVLCDHSRKYGLNSDIGTSFDTHKNQHVMDGWIILHELVLSIRNTYRREDILKNIE